MATGAERQKSPWRSRLEFLQSSRVPSLWVGTVLAALLHHRSLVLALNRLGWVVVLVLLLLLHRQVRLGYSLPFAGSPLQVAERKSHSLVSQQKGALGEQGRMEDGEPVNTS